MIQYKVQNMKLHLTRPIICVRLSSMPSALGARRVERPLLVFLRFFLLRVARLLGGRFAMLQQVIRNVVVPLGQRPIVWGSSAMILPIRMRARLDELDHDGVVSLDRRPVHGAHVRVVLEVVVGAVFDEPLHDLKTAVPRGQDHRRVAHAVPSVELGPGLEQKLHRVDVPAHTRHHQSRVALGVLDVRRVVLEPPLDLGVVALPRGID